MMQPCKTTLQKFIYKHMVDLEIVQRNKKKEKCHKSITHNRSAVSLHVKTTYNRSAMVMGGVS
jgi:hypothetical protein